MSVLMQYEGVLRFSCFAGVLLFMAVWELVAPRRRLIASKPLRWGSNIGLVFVSSFVLRLIAPLGAVGVAIVAERLGWGLFNVVSAPSWLAIVTSVLLLDFAIYIQHVMFHAVPILWRLHMVHHADHDVDVTTGLRFHTVEILLSLGIKAGVILLLGPPAVAVLIFEVLLNATSMFNHSNVAMTFGVDRVLRWLVVTPDMHRVHHSHYANETNSNFGFNLPWWDRLFGTYQGQPVDGHVDMRLGLDQFPDKRQTSLLPWMLLVPFVGDTGKYPINRRTTIKDESRQITSCDKTASVDRGLEKVCCEK
jgi:sterol desaturase/sphingolipid hydroxylase (fatty acid hydroxylase superfamily)